MGKQRVLLLGATGETGGSILNGLLEDADSFDVEALVRPSSKDKPAVKDLAKRGVTIRVVDIEGPLDDVAKALAGIDVLISAIDAMSQLAQLHLATAAKQAGVKRFVPCGFITVAPPGIGFELRDSISFPTLPSGRVDYAAFAPRLEIHADGIKPNLLTDIRDIGRFVAHIIKDPRTLNKFVVAYSDVLSENEIFAIMEEMSGEVIERKHVSADEVIASREHWTATQKAEPDNRMAKFMKISHDYYYSTYVRGDNTPEYAAYLGYLDAKDLYLDFSPQSFRQLVGELLEGKAVKPYPRGTAL